MIAQNLIAPATSVQFQGIVRKLDGTEYALPGAGEVAIEIRDADESAVQKFNLPVSARGTFNGSFTSNSEDKPGVYSVHATYNGAEENYYVNLAAYRKPEFAITVSPAKKYIVFGEKGEAKVKAEYYFGGPVVGAKVEAYITRSEHYSFPADDYSDESDDEGGDSGGYSTGGSASASTARRSRAPPTRRERQFSISIPRFKAIPSPEADYDYTVNATITDSSNKAFDGAGTVLVTRGDLNADLSVDEYVASPGDTVTAEVHVTRQDNDQPVAGRGVSILLGTERWNGGTTATFLPGSTLFGTTDAKGIARIPIKAGNEGSLVLKSTVLDDAGHHILSEDYLYVEGDTTLGPPTARFTVTTDKKSYSVGGRCKVMIQTDKPGGSALVTIQAEKVLATYVVELKKQSTVVTFPVTMATRPTSGCQRFRSRTNICSKLRRSSSSI